jgi:phage terminase large subunit
VSANVLLEFVQRYGPPAGERGPERLVEEVLGATPDQWQRDTLRAFGRGERRISIRSCHGPGKTALLAWLVWCMLLTRFPQKTVATAPSRGQLEDALVSEILKWGTRLPPIITGLFEMKKNRIELRSAPDESFFSARTAREENPEALQGVHSDHVLLIADEASGVPEKIFEAAAGSMSGHSATTVLASNPVRSTGFFFNTWHKLSDMWFRVHVGYKDSPRVTEDFALDIARRYGEDSNQYRVRVLGEFPLADQDTIIPWHLIESAQKRDIVQPPGMREVWGLDVARFGEDANVLVRRNKLAVLPDIQRWRGIDLMATAGRVKAAWDACPVGSRPQEILVDAIGLGGGVVDRLQELRLPVRGINVSETAAMNEKYRGLKTELWFKCREWLAMKDRALPSGGEDGIADELATELSLVRYKYTSSGLLQAESKAETKKRGHKSPDLADAVMLTFASEPTTLLQGSRSEQGWQKDWGEPLHRGLQMV